MASFEVFTRGVRAPESKTPFVTLRRSGNFAVSPAAWELLNRPEAVHLLWSPDDGGIVGMQEVGADAPNAYVLRKTSGKPSDLTVAGSAFVKNYGIEQYLGFRFPTYTTVWAATSVLCFNLTTGVAINRPKPRVTHVDIPAGGPDTDVAKHIRRWAISRGLMSESTRGPLPGKIRRAYEAEQRGQD